MALYRSIQTNFWTDTKITDDFSPEERYLYLYLLTNQYTTLSGCYEITYRQIAFDTGLTAGKVKEGVDALQGKHNAVRYSEGNREMLLLNWYKYNWTASEKFRKPLLAQIESVKTQEFREYLTARFNGTDTVQIPYEHGMNTPKAERPTKEYPYGKVIEYLNAKTGKQFSADTKDTRRYIKARCDEGRTLEDFYKVIDNMVAKWKGDAKMQDYLRPQTLFGTKFESYLNASPVKVVDSKNRFNNFTQRDYDFEELERKLVRRTK